MDPEAEQLLEREADLPMIKHVLRSEFARPGRSRTALTFNVTNVCLDFENGTATVDDELDVGVSVTIPLDDLRRYCE